MDGYRPQLALRCSLALFLPIIWSMTGCLGQRRVSDRDVQFIERQTLIEQIEKARSEPDKQHLLLIDPRLPSEYEEGHLPGARNVRLLDIDLERGRDPRFTGYDAIVVYGDHPSSAPAIGMAKRLMRLKYKNVRVYEGGVADWQAQGRQLVTGPQPYANNGGIDGGAAAADGG